jgi:predicted transcriptional regulator
MAKHGLTPDQYRERWGLPSDYPMVAPNYAKARSEVAKASGLGRAKLATPKESPRPQTEKSKPRVGRRKITSARSRRGT